MENIREIKIQAHERLRELETLESGYAKPIFPTLQTGLTLLLVVHIYARNYANKLILVQLNFSEHVVPFRDNSVPNCQLPLNGSLQNCL